MTRSDRPRLNGIGLPSAGRSGSPISARIGVTPLGSAPATARAVLNSLFEPQVREAPPPPRAPSRDHRARAEISRRDLLRGRFARA